MNEIFWDNNRILYVNPDIFHLFMTFYKKKITHLKYIRHFNLKEDQNNENPKKSNLNNDGDDGLSDLDLDLGDLDLDSLDGGINNTIKDKFKNKITRERETIQANELV